jgi:glycosyltransferase involved in cell wall biosynthesis
LKILFAHRSYYPSFKEGGDTMILYDIATELAKMGEEVTVCVTNSNADEDLTPEHLGIKNIEGVKVCTFPRSKNKIGKWLRYSREWLKYMRYHIHEYDIVHIWSIFSFTSIATAFLAWKANKPFIVSPQANFSPFSLKKNKLIKLVYLKTIEFFTLRKAVGFQCNTKYDALWAKDQGIPSNKILSIVSYGIRDFVELWEPKKQKPERMFLFMGRLDPIKGLDFLLQVIKSLVHEKKEECKLILIGSITSGYEEIFKKMVTQYNLDAYVEHKGFADNHLKNDLLQKTSALILPSYTESFGLVVVEAMAMGIPVSISDQCNVREHVEKARCGYVLPHKIEPWVSALTQLLNEPQKGQEMGLRGREYFQEYLTVRSCAEGLKTNYQGILHGAGRKINIPEPNLSECT